MGNNPVGKKVPPKVNTYVNTFLLLALGFYLNPRCQAHWLGVEVGGAAGYLSRDTETALFVCSPIITVDHGEFLAHITKTARYHCVIVSSSSSICRRSPETRIQRS